MEKSTEFKPWKLILIIGLIMLILFLLLKPKKSTRVTGGEGGREVLCADSASFVNAAKSSETLVIVVVGSYKIGYCYVKSNKSLVGQSEKSTLSGTLRVEGANNVVIKYLNLTAPIVKGATQDAIAIVGSTNVLVTKCNIYDWTDGGCDVVKGSKSTEISWCHFWVTYNYDHALAVLVGSDPADPDDASAILKLHHNWFGGGVKDRCPFGRKKEISMWNNVFEANTSYSTVSSYVTAATGVKIYSRANVFINGEDPYIKKETGGLINNKDDIFYPAVTKVVNWNDNVSAPSYELTELMPASSVESAVKAGAGVVISVPAPQPPGNADTTVTCRYDTVITRHCDTVIVIRPEPEPEPQPDGVIFALVDAVTEEELFNIQNNQIVRLTGLANLKLNVRAITGSDITSVKFALTGQQAKNYTDKEAPFALHGDDGNGNYYYGNWNPPAIGLYKLTVTPYKGTVAQPVVEVNFSFAN